MPRSHIELVSLDAVPFAHCPGRCEHFSRFEALRERHPDLEATAVGRMFFEHLTDTDFATCSYHDANWVRIAKLSVEVVASMGSMPNTPGNDWDAIEAKLSRLVRGDLPERDAFWLWSLFDDPIYWRPGATEVVNGQHRLCALRAAGVLACPVDVD